MGLTQSLAVIGKRSGGLGLLLAWLYCSFFSCGLISRVMVLRSSERVWFWVGIGTAVCALVVIALRTGFLTAVAHSKAVGVLAALCAAAGSCLIWIAFSGDQWNQALSTAGGLVAGAGLALMTVIWGQRLSGFEVSKLERTVPEAFIIAFALYFVLLAVKGFLFLFACVLMPIGSMLLAFRYASAWICPFERECACGPGKPMEAAAGMKFRSMAPMFVLYFLMWMQFSSFRLISSPDVIGDRFMHYLVPFCCAAVVAIGLFLLCMRASRFLNYSLMYRLTCPLMMFGCIIFLFGPNAWFDFRSVAYAMNFMGMFGVQLTLWVVTPKAVCRMGFNPVLAFCCFLVAEGLGVAVGLRIALPFIGQEQSLGMLPLVLTGMIMALAMIIGFKPEWFFAKHPANPLFIAKEGLRWDIDGNASELLPVGYRPASDGGFDGGEADGVAARRCPERCQPQGGQNREEGNFDVAVRDACIGNADIALIFEAQARVLQIEFGLTERETQVCALMLAGRSRPYIRDELIISLNTVHTHAHNIFRKCEVKSQQELMSLPERMAK